MSPAEFKLPDGAVTPSAISDGAKVHVVYGQNGNAYYRLSEPSSPVRVNSVEGSVHAANERGPKIALTGRGTICVAWQPGHMDGAHVWFARSTDGGRSFDDQRDVLQGSTPGVDHVTVAASDKGDTVGVFWIDGRGGEDDKAPVTAELWYTISRDGGKTFGANRRVEAQAPIRACACCSLDVRFTGATTATILYRGGKAGMREIWKAEGDAVTDRWRTSQLTTANWELNGCPMDGPRSSDAYITYFMKGRCYLLHGKETTDLGPGKYPSVLNIGNDAFVAWQEGSILRWRYKKTGESGQMAMGASRATVVMGPDKTRPLVIH